MNSETQYTKLCTALLAETERRIVDESIPRIEKCLSLLSDEEIWRRPNSELVSIGNLVLHVIGNARQWIISGLGGFPDQRNRESEFNADGEFNKQKLLEELRKLKVDLPRILHSIQPSEMLRLKEVQVYRERGVSMLIHATEHFSYHTGQIVWYTKMLKEQDLNFYPEI